MAANGILDFQGTNQVNFMGAASNIVIDTVTASLGIGVDVNGPTSNLHVVGNAHVSTNLTIGGNIDFIGNLTQGGAPYGGGSGGSSPWLPTTVNVPADGIYYTAGNVAVDTNTFFVDSVNNRVGVGTDSPDTILHVEAASNPQILVEDTGSANQSTIRFKTATTDWTVGQHGGETGKFKIANHTVLGTNDHITIDTSGNVGIGMIDPGAKLDVNGIVKATNLDLDGNVVRSAANITLAANSWAKIADFAGLVTGGHYLISIKWDNSALVGGGTAIWYGGMTYSTYVIGTASVYNTTGDELIKYNAHYHYRTISAFEFVQDSDSSSGNYGQHSIYMKSPQSAIVASGVSVTAYRIG